MSEEVAVAIDIEQVVRSVVADVAAQWIGVTVDFEEERIRRRRGDVRPRDLEDELPGPLVSRDGHGCDIARSTAVAGRVGVGPRRGGWHEDENSQQRRCDRADALQAQGDRWARKA